MSNEEDNEMGSEKKAALDHQLSMPSRHQDPFAVREGKTLLWKDINMRLVSTMMLVFAAWLWGYEKLERAMWNTRDRRLILASFFSLVSMLDFSNTTTAHQNRLETARTTPNACCWKMCGARSLLRKRPPSWARLAPGLVQK